MQKLNSIKNSFSQLNNLIIYRNIIKDELIVKFSNFISNLNSNEEYDIFNLKNQFYEICSQLISLAEKEKFKKDIWQYYLLYLIITDENIFTIMSEKYGNNIGENLNQAAVHDLKILRKHFQYNLYDIGKFIGEKIDFIQDFSPTTGYAMEPPYLKMYAELQEIFKNDNFSSNKLVNSLINFYNSTGTGEMARYTTFRWNNGELIGIKNPDPVHLDDLIGYKTQKGKLIKNTETFLKGKRANNVLLFGDSGTGKSTSVKALVNEYYARGLRLIEIDKLQINDLPVMLDILKKRGLKYIIFMDDLSFDDYETNYKYLKALIEGGVEVKPDNVLFYATSNRRHIIKEKWSDRNGEDREIHLTDALQEKFSLVDRFGITINYQAPDQKNYLKIVKELAKRNNININIDKLMEKALHWEKRNNGMSGRTAQQFINYIAGFTQN